MDRPADPRTPALDAGSRAAEDAARHARPSGGAISSPAAGRIPDWTASVLKEMVEVRDAFDQHVVVTERPDGLYDEILERAPRLAGNVSGSGRSTRTSRRRSTR